MIVLGFDTATPATAVGLRLAEGTILQARDDPRPEERPGHSTRLLGLADGLLAQAHLDWGALELIAVGVGPGTFTGLRIGVATARALAQSQGVELVGVSTLRALAHNAARASDLDAPNVLAVIDARRGEVFVGAYRAERQLAAPRALPPEALADLLRGVSLPEGGASGAMDPSASASPAKANWLAVGDGAIRFRAHLEEAGAEVPEDASELHRVSGASICELALEGTPEPPEAIVPDYLRRPDAEIALDAGIPSHKVAAR